MADLIATKATFPKSGGLAVADGAVSVNAGNGLHVNPSTGMVEVPVDTTAGLGYGSNGLEVEVDGSTIDFNSTGQLTALGGGGGNSLTPFTANNGTALGNWTISTDNSDNSAILECCGAYCDEYIYIQSEYIKSSRSYSTILKITRTDGKKIALGNVTTNADISSPNTGCAVSVIGNTVIGKPVDTSEARLSVNSNATNNSITLRKNTGNWGNSALCFIIGAFICVKE